MPERARTVTQTSNTESVGMIPREDLLKWNGFLHEQVRYFDACIVRETGNHWIADEVNASFLEFHEEAEKTEIEDAILSFAKTDSWPALNARQSLHLLFRLTLASELLAEAIKTPDFKLQPQPPDHSNRPEFIKWMLIVLWRLAGANYIRVLSSDFLERRGFTQQARQTEPPSEDAA
jgi:hypothetical protein